MNDKILKIENELYNDLNNYILMLKDLENKTNGTDIDILIEKDKEREKKYSHQFIQQKMQQEAVSLQ